MMVAVPRKSLEAKKTIGTFDAKDPTKDKACEINIYICIYIYISYSIVVRRRMAIPSETI
jgi:hypothetical protein